MISQQVIHQLLHDPSPEKLTILGPTHRYGHQVIQGQDSLNLKTNLKEARHRLKLKGWEEQRINKFLKPAQELIHDPSFWPYLSDGLAIFLSEQNNFILKLPVHFDNMVYLSNEFYIKPLLPLIGTPNRLFILCLSQNQVAFYEASAHSITAVKIDDLVPMSLEEALVDKTEKVLQAHGSASGHAMQFHGHGSRNDLRELQLEKYLRAIDTGLMKMLHDERPPLLFAGVDELFSKYQEINSYPALWETHISGNPFPIDVMTLHEKAWKEIKPHVEAEKNTFTRKYYAHVHKDITSSNIGSILQAAEAGRVACLFTRDDKNLWGEYDSTKGNIKIHPMRSPESKCLLNMSTIKVLKQKGTAFNLPAGSMPSQVKSPIAAIFRY